PPWRAVRSPVQATAQARLGKRAAGQMAPEPEPTEVVPFSGSATRHTRSPAELITTTSGLKFSVPTSPRVWVRRSPNRGKERQLVEARGQPGDELFQAVVQ